MEQVNYYEHFREHNHVERSLGHKDKQRMSATSQVKKRRRTSTTHQCKCCDKVFSRSANLRRHMLTHTEEKPHECSECHKKFSLLRTLQRHMLTHTGEKPYECPECHRTFSQLGTLRRHTLQTHTDEKPHECPECHRTIRHSFRWAIDPHRRETAGTDSISHYTSVAGAMQALLDWTARDAVFQDTDIFTQWVINNMLL